MSSKTFTIGGTSTVGSTVTVRVANGDIKVREGILKRAGHTDIKLAALQAPMTRDEFAASLAAQGIVAVIPKGGKKAAEGAEPKAPKTPRVPKAAKTVAAATPAAEVPAETFGQRMSRIRAQKKADAEFLASQQGGEQAAA